MTKLQKAQNTMAPNKEILLDEIPNAPVLKIDIGEQIVELDLNMIRQFLFDMSTVKGGLQGLSQTITEFEEFTSDYYPDEFSAIHLKQYYKILKFSRFFFGNVASYTTKKPTV